MFILDDIAIAAAMAEAITAAEAAAAATAAVEAAAATEAAAAASQAAAATEAAAANQAASAGAGGQAAGTAGAGNSAAMANAPSAGYWNMSASAQPSTMISGANPAQYVAANGASTVSGAGASGAAGTTGAVNPLAQAATRSMAPLPAAPPPAAPPPGGILGSGITGSDAMMGAMGANAVSNAMMSPNGDMSNPMEEDRKRRMAASQSNVNAFNSNKGMKTGGAVKGFAKGGSIVAKPVERRRGDGIAQRGRTKGRMV